MFNVKDQGVLLALGGDISEAGDGWTFHGNRESPLQLGTCRLMEKTTLQPHDHKVRARITGHKTHEVIIVMAGSIEATFYGLDRRPIVSHILKAGGFVFLYDGGHGFHVLEDGTRLIEVKNGPFAPTEEDKERF
ncbi:hypothetical protein LCGC14_0968640 [marine sediment metagenome]|uniref:Uncharacterized protein n=1 Tax=marine sediment metagenome TaxID=412755 RepID=A0A0F9NGU2_9ZZZZ